MTPPQSIIKQQQLNYMFSWQPAAFAHDSLRVLLRSKYLAIVIRILWNITEMTLAEQTASLEADSRFVNQGIHCISKSLDQPQLILIT
jgi:hypothetical protein